MSEARAAALRLLISAYACEPGGGSEAGRAWNLAAGLAERHQVWVITRANNRPLIEAALAQEPKPGLHFVYYDLPSWARFWKRGGRGVEPYYYLWQVAIYPLARRLHRRVSFDIVHHVAFGRHWSPSFLSLLPAPFVWGPLGGGDSAPPSFRKGLSKRGAALERLRVAARWAGEHDPFVRSTNSRAAVALARTPETAQRLRALGSRRVRLVSLTALTPEEAGSLPGRRDDDRPFRVVSIGNLLHYKGFHLGLRAFASSGLEGAEYWIIGDGPERPRLVRLAEQLGVSELVRFWGRLPRAQVLERLHDCDVLVHPSLHDSFGWVCMEAMGAGLPVICLDLGGPATQVTDQTGFKVAARDPDQAVSDMARGLRELHADPDLRAHMGAMARKRVEEKFNWPIQLGLLEDIYRLVVG